MNLPIYELTINQDLNDNAEVSYISLVDAPAIKKEFLAFNEDLRMANKFEVISEDQRIISGPLILADMLIYRNNEIFGEHYVKFSAETIKQIAIKFAKRKNLDKVNLMHDEGQRVSGLTLFESFIVDKSRGILPMKGYEDVADGSWFGSFYVENPEVWMGIKEGLYKGFSVEGLFDYMKPISADQEALQKIEKLLNEITTD